MHPRGRAAAFLITVALSEIGPSTDLAGFRRAGSRPLIFGGLLRVMGTGTGTGTGVVSKTIETEGGTVLDIRPTVGLIATFILPGCRGYLL